MKYKKWVGRRLDDLRLPWEQFTILHPDIKKTNYKALRRYHKINGETPMPTPEHEPTAEREVTSEQVIDGQIVQTTDGWYEMLTANPEDPENPVVTRLYKHSTTTRPENGGYSEDTFDIVTPARITPSRRKVPNREYRTYFVFGDTQIDYRKYDDDTYLPTHDDRAMRVARLICRDLQPDEIVNLGDTMDMAAISRFKKDSNHFKDSIRPAAKRVHQMYAEYRADNPDAKIVEVDSNHHTRLRDYILANAPELYTLRYPTDEDGAYPIWSYPRLVDLAHLGVEWVSGYGAAEYRIGGNEDLIARHGRETSSNGTAASKIMKNHPETNNVHGHSHEMSMATKTLRSGRVLASVAVGALCRTDGSVPGYHSAVDDHNEVVHRQQNWQQSVLAIYDYGNGHYQFDQIPIINGKAFYNGKEYTGGDDGTV